jgi:hypothetical protein
MKIGVKGLMASRVPFIRRQISQGQPIVLFLKDPLKTEIRTPEKPFKGASSNSPFED